MPLTLGLQSGMMHAWWHAGTGVVFSALTVSAKRQIHLSALQIRYVFPFRHHQVSFLLLLACTEWYPQLALLLIQRNSRKRGFMLGLVFAFLELKISLSQVFIETLQFIFAHLNWVMIFHNSLLN